MVDQTFSELRKDAAYDTDSGHSFVDTAELRALIAAYDALSIANHLKPIDENTPKDQPILAWCDHEADPYFISDDHTRLTLYAAHAEGLSHAPTGWQIVEWGGAWDDRTYEYDGGWLPDWWFVTGSEFECAANPLFWMELPSKPKYERKIVNQGANENE